MKHLAPLLKAEVHGNALIVSKDNWEDLTNYVNDLCDALNTSEARIAVLESNVKTLAGQVQTLARILEDKNA